MAKEYKVYRRMLIHGERGFGADSIPMEELTPEELECWQARVWQKSVQAQYNALIAQGYDVEISDPDALKEVEPVGRLRKEEINETV